VVWAVAGGTAAIGAVSSGAGWEVIASGVIGAVSSGEISGAIASGAIGCGSDGSDGTEFSGGSGWLGSGGSCDITNFSQAAQIGLNAVNSYRCH
jgi:hypothetical protein